jgi:hypothetical protein
MPEVVEVAERIVEEQAVLVEEELEAQECQPRLGLMEQPILVEAVEEAVLEMEALVGQVLWWFVI